MLKRKTGILLAFSFIALGSRGATSSPEIPFTKFTLNNGLTVIVHEDRKAPIVTTNIWYHVGSKDEKPGRTGFAHLFEHLMFQGSEHYNDEFFRPFEAIGATQQNGTTNQDRTNYYQTVPTSALDVALWLESDRMGHLLGVIDQARLDEQRGVVQNEKREGDNAPYGRVDGALFKASYPEGHPYRWETIGSMEDLNAASLDDVKAWFKAYYGPNNAVLVLAGDIDAETAKTKVERYFGAIPPAPPLTHYEKWIAPRTEAKRDLMYDQVAQARVLITFNVPEFGTEDAARLDLLAQILGGGKTSRLYQRLVYREQIADAVEAFNFAQELGGVFGISVDVKRDVDPSRAENAVREELARLVEKEVEAAELARAKTGLKSAFVRGTESIGGSTGKANILAQCQVFAQDPACYQTENQRYAQAGTADLLAVAKRWLARGDYTLTVLPQLPSQAEKETLDRGQGIPKVAEFPNLRFPAIERAELNNDIQLAFAKRDGIPAIELQIVFDGGYAADGAGRPGIGSFVMAMLDEGTGKKSAIDVAAALEDIGAQLSASATIDTSVVRLSVLKERLPEALGILADVVQRPAFKEADITRIKKIWLAKIAQEKTEPVSLALRALPPLLYGERHAYGVPLTGSGTEPAIAAIERGDLVDFHRTWLRADNASIFAVGDIEKDELLEALNRHFGAWESPSAERGAKQMVEIPDRTQAKIYLIDKPQAPQSLILAGQLLPSTKSERYLETETMNNILGGLFTARLNMNLREAKHWAYGAYSFSINAQHQRPLIFYAPVQTDKTAASMAEILREIQEYRGGKPASEDELANVVAGDVRSMPGQYETMSAVLDELVKMKLYGRPDDYVPALKQRIEGQSLTSIRAIAKEQLKPDQLVWVVVGDRQAIEKEVRALGIAEVEILTPQ